MLVTGMPERVLACRKRRNRNRRASLFTSRLWDQLRGKPAGFLGTDGTVKDGWRSAEAMWRSLNADQTCRVVLGILWNAGGEGKCCVGTSLVTASASSSIVFDGTCRATTPWSLQPIAGVAPRWPSKLGSVSAAGDREQRRHRKPRHRKGDRGDHERREADRLRRHRTPCPRWEWIAFSYMSLPQ